jgi:VanZ family protein
LRRIEFFFRGAFAATLATVTHLATTPIQAVPAFALSDKVAHAAAFFVLAFLLDFSFPATPLGGVKALSLLAYGMLLEIVQYFLPYRLFSVLDFVADGAGVALYAAILPILCKMPFIGAYREG